MITRKVLLASTLIAPALAMSSPASAATAFDGQGSVNITNGNGAFFDTAIPAGMFNDTIEFDVTSDGIADVGVLYFKAVQGITSLAATFNGAPISFTNLGGDLYSGGIKAPIAPGKQTITVSGNSTGVSAGYSGTVKFAAVPELGTWLMMVAGIGFVGFALRRRRADYKVNFAF